MKRIKLLQFFIDLDASYIFMRLKNSFVITELRLNSATLYSTI
jgi:hypothetical protein